MGTTQLGMVGVCGAIAKQTEKPRDFSMQYVDISINGRPARAMVDFWAEANIMTKTVAERLRLNYVPRNSRLKTVNAPTDSSMQGRPRSEHRVGKVAM